MYIRQNVDFPEIVRVSHSSVLFADALEKIPAGAVVVEVSPHGLLQAILRRSLTEATPIPLIRKDAKCTHTHFLEAVGK